MNRHDAIGTVLITGLLCFLVSMGFVAYSLSQPKPIDPESLCPTDQTVPHTVMLVDRTDRFTKDHIELFNKTVVRTRASLTIQERFSIFLIDAEVAPAQTPVFSLCRPAGGKDAHWLYENPRLIQSRFEESFAEPLAEIVRTLKEPSEADTSPIMETIREIAALPEFSETVGRRRLIIVSDLLQNVTAYSQYRRSVSYEEFRALSYATTVETKLIGVRVDLVYLRNRKVARLQTPEHRALWVRYFAVSGAARVNLVN